MIANTQALSQVLAELEALGAEQNRKVYRRHGIGENAYGVSCANLRGLSKKMKVDHTLALRLWATGNHDARILATMVADPKQADDELLNAWAGDVFNYVLGDALSAYIGKTRFVRQKAEQWTPSSDEWLGSLGWNLLSYLAMDDRDLPDSYFEDYIAVIERDLHGSKNRLDTR